MMETIILNIAEKSESIDISVTEFIEDINVTVKDNVESITAVIQEAVIIEGQEYEYRHKYIEPTSWLGKAVKGSAIDEPVWTVTKIIVNLDGTTLTETFYYQKWSDYV